MDKAPRRGGRSSPSASDARFSKHAHPTLGVPCAGDSVCLQPPPDSVSATEMLARIEYFSRPVGIWTFLGSWYYRPADVPPEGSDRIPKPVHPRELYLLDHQDINSTDSILERIDVWSATDYESLLAGAAGPTLPVTVIAAGYVCRLLYGASDFTFLQLDANVSDALQVSARRHGRAPVMGGGGRGGCFGRGHVRCRGAAAGCHSGGQRGGGGAGKSGHPGRWW